MNPELPPIECGCDKKHCILSDKKRYSDFITSMQMKTLINDQHINKYKIDDYQRYKCNTVLALNSGINLQKPIRSECDLIRKFFELLHLNDSLTLNNKEFYETQLQMSTREDILIKNNNQEQMLNKKLITRIIKNKKQIDRIELENESIKTELKTLKRKNKKITRMIVEYEHKSAKLSDKNLELLKPTIRSIEEKEPKEKKIFSKLVEENFIITKYERIKNYMLYNRKSLKTLSRGKSIELIDQIYDKFISLKIARNRICHPIIKIHSNKEDFFSDLFN